MNKMYSLISRFFVVCTLFFVAQAVIHNAAFARPSADVAAVHAAPAITWTPAGLTTLEVDKLVIAPTISSTVYAIAGSFPNLEKTTDAGANWAEVTVTGLPVYSIAVDPKDANILYAGNFNEIAKSIDGGKNWVSGNATCGGAQVIAIDPTNSKIVYAGRSGGCGIYKSINGGASWTDLGITLDTTSLLFAPSDSHILYAGGKNYSTNVFGGVLKGVYDLQNKLTWTHTLTNTDVNAIAVDPTNAQVVYAGTENDGIQKSTNGGATWTPVNNGLGQNTTIRALVSDPTDHNVLYAGTWGGGVFRTLDGGANWAPVNDGLTFTFVSALAINPMDTRIIYAGTQGHGVFKTIVPDPPTVTPPTITPTHTPTNTPTGTPTNTPTNTPTPTPTTTVTTTPPTSDEPNDSCDQAKNIPPNGVMEEHTFGAPADVDWLRFDATQNVAYRIEVQVPAGSPADVYMEVYTACNQAPTTIWNRTFTPGVRLDFTAPSTGPVFLKLNNTDAGVGGAQVVYQIAVQNRTAPQVGALILVAGRYKLNDPLQANIHNITNQVYALFQAHGYTSDRIQYLATDSTLPGYDLSATKNNLHAAIASWAVDKVGGDKSLTLYLADHGDTNAFYLDAVNQELVNPAELDSWLTELETQVPGVKINVIMESCNSGSFLNGTERISKPNRVVITSTSADELAYASITGARFSDYLLVGLKEGDSLSLSFRAAQSAVQKIWLWQQPWLDGNGNGVPNEAEDDAVAALRSFGSSTLDTDSWPPYIVRAQLASPVTNRHGILQATVRDDKQVRRVWAVIYAPSYKPPQTRNELVSETALPTVVLQAQGNEQFSADYPGFDEIGIYRIAVYAEDDDGLVGAPVVLEVGSQVFLPLVSG